MLKGKKDFKLKIPDLKEQLEKSENSTMEACRAKISALKEKHDQMALQLVDQECKFTELREKFESLEKRKQFDYIIIQLASIKYRCCCSLFFLLTVTLCLYIFQRILLMQQSIALHESYQIYLCIFFLTEKEKILVTGQFFAFCQLDLV